MKQLCISGAVAFAAATFSAGCSTFAEQSASDGARDELRSSGGTTTYTVNGITASSKTSDLKKLIDDRHPSRCGGAALTIANDLSAARVSVHFRKLEIAGTGIIRTIWLYSAPVIDAPAQLFTGSDFSVSMVAVSDTGFTVKRTQADGKFQEVVGTIDGANCVLAGSTETGQVATTTIPYAQAAHPAADVGTPGDSSVLQANTCSPIRQSAASVNGTATVLSLVLSQLGPALAEAQPDVLLAVSMDIAALTVRALSVTCQPAPAPPPVSPCVVYSCFGSGANDDESDVGPVVGGTSSCAYRGHLHVENARPWMFSIGYTHCDGDGLCTSSTIPVAGNNRYSALRDDFVCQIADQCACGEAPTCHDNACMRAD